MGADFSRKLKSRRGNRFPFGALSLTESGTFATLHPKLRSDQNERIDIACVRTEQQHSFEDQLFLRRFESR